MHSNRYTLEFEGSEIASVAECDGDLVVRFSAAAATDDSSRTEGHLQSVELIVHQASWRGHLGLCFGRLSSGSLAAEGATSTGASRLPVPHQSHLPVRLELLFRNGEALAVGGASVTLRTNGPTAFFESYAC
ncbi:hypothetical protein AACH06_18810 [Ideonella sp. DXS29W]|uniref:Uncharacterized protein n=1 Tax=Ideonella lacteola TaxID=2984193 RepID=A0ABU9BSC3_9BURK